MAVGRTRRAALAMRREFMMDWSVVGMQLRDYRSVAVVNREVLQLGAISREIPACAG
jgi:hypothetical protein